MAKLYAVGVPSLLLGLGATPQAAPIEVIMAATNG